MNKIALLSMFVMLVSALFSQPPQAFKYLAVARDNAGNVIANQNVSFRIGILQGSASANKNKALILSLNRQEIFVPQYTRISSKKNFSLSL